MKRHQKQKKHPWKWEKVPVFKSKGYIYKYREGPQQKGANAITLKSFLQLKWDFFSALLKGSHKTMALI